MNTHYKLNISKVAGFTLLIVFILEKFHLNLSAWEIFALAVVAICFSTEIQDTQVNFFIQEEQEENEITEEQKDEYSENNN